MPNCHRIIQQIIATASDDDKNMWSQNVTTSQKKCNLSATPYAFTEQGLAMLSGILNSDKAIKVNIAIMRAFVFIRQYALTHKDLTEKLKELESKYNKQFADVYEALNYLLDKTKDKLNKNKENLLDINQKTEICFEINMVLRK